MDTILFPIMWVISWIMYGIHSLLIMLGMSEGSGAAWVLSIAGLTIVIRILIIPLFNKQIQATRLSQELQPEIQKLQAKYKGRKDQISQQRQQEELMALYRDRGTSPFASCLPMLVQMPIFFALFRLLYAVAPISDGLRDPIGAINEDIAEQIANSTLFGAPLSSSLGTATEYSLTLNVRVVAVVLIALMIITLFYSQKQIMMKNMPEAAQDPNNQAYKMQKYMLYGMPFIYIFTGFAFQIGVLVYWLTSNIWNIGQQTWLITYNPTPGSPAWKKRQEKIRAKRIAKGLPPDEEKEDDDAEEQPTGQREQPLGKERSKKAAAKATNTQETEEPNVNEDGEVLGPDGLTDDERAQRRYERRMAQRERSRQKRKKRQKRQKRQQQNQKKRNF
ncbi:MAG: membrane protein insertase YidC [Actinomycetaceae bacterium]|nr:membrane protein insertase YidC [Actinomycetaceae bacterium]